MAKHDAEFGEENPVFTYQTVNKEETIIYFILLFKWGRGGVLGVEMSSCILFFVDDLALLCFFY